MLPMVIGGFSGSPTRAALYAGVVMAVLTFVAARVSGGLIPTRVVFALALMPPMMALGLIGHGVRCVFRRIRAPEEKRSVSARGGIAPRAREGARNSRRRAS